MLKRALAVLGLLLVVAVDPRPVGANSTGIQAWTYGDRAPWSSVFVNFWAELDTGFCYEYMGIQYVEIVGDDGFYDSSTPYFWQANEHSGVFEDWFAASLGYDYIQYELRMDYYSCEWGWDSAYTWLYVIPETDYPETISGYQHSYTGQTGSFCPTGSNCCGAKYIRNHQVYSQWNRRMDWLTGSWDEDIQFIEQTCAANFNTGGGAFTDGQFLDNYSICAPNGHGCCTDQNFCNNVAEQWIKVNNHWTIPPRYITYRCTEVSVYEGW